MNLLLKSRGLLCFVPVTTRFLRCMRHNNQVRGQNCMSLHHGWISILEGMMQSTGQLQAKTGFKKNPNDYFNLYNDIRACPSKLLLLHEMARRLSINLCSCVNAGQAIARETQQHVLKYHFFSRYKII